MNSSRLRPTRITALLLRVRASRVKQAAASALRPHRPVVLTAHAPDGTSISLRPPRLHDAPAWRAARLTNQHRIEPFWSASSTPWEHRHTDAAWAHECHDARRAARAGTCLSFVIEQNGHFYGQILLDNIDTFNHTAEVGIWTRADTPTATAHIAARTVIDTAFTTLGIERVTAPVHPDNDRAQRFAERLGFTCEGRMRNYFTTCTGRADHLLYAITRPVHARRPSVTEPALATI